MIIKKENYYQRGTVDVKHSVDAVGWVNCDNDGSAGRGSIAIALHSTGGIPFDRKG